MHQEISRHDDRSAATDVSPYLAAMAIVVGLIIAWVSLCAV